MISSLICSQSVVSWKAGNTVALFRGKSARHPIMMRRLSARINRSFDHRSIRYIHSRVCLVVRVSVRISDIELTCKPSINYPLFSQVTSGDILRVRSSPARLCVEEIGTLYTSLFTIKMVGSTVDIRHTHTEMIY